MPRLVSFGCSYTFGSAMPDAWPVKLSSRIPSSYAWPKLLANKLNYDVLNLGFGGAGNLEILWNIMSTDFIQDDLVIILWTHFTRLEHFKFIEPSISETIDDPKYSEHFKFATKSGYRVPMNLRILKADIGYDLATRNYLVMDHGSLFLKNKGLKAFHILATGEYIYPKHSNIAIENFLDIKPDQWHVDKALDNIHPGVESQKLLASLIYDKIKEYELR